MQLIDRYLYAVGRHLPAKRRDDILAELRANILAMAEDREQELGRTLTLEEEEAILRKHGHPMLVAARYLPQQYLIGPTVFPFYVQIMKLAFPWVVLLYLLAHVVEFISQPVTAQALVEIGLQFFPTMFYFAGWFTLIFALLEFASTHYMKNANVMYTWSPRKLPEIDVAVPEREKRSNPVFDLCGSIVGLFFLIVIRQHPMWLIGPGIFYKNMLRPAPVWQTVFEIAIVLTSIQIVVKSAALFSPKVRGWRIAVDLITKASAIGVLAYLVRFKEFVVPGPNSNLAEMQKLADALNTAMTIGWKVVLVILSIQLVWAIGQTIFPRWHVHAKPSLFLS
jgi:hypothetical protein